MFHLILIWNLFQKTNNGNELRLIVNEIIEINMIIFYHYVMIYFLRMKNKYLPANVLKRI